MEVKGYGIVIPADWTPGRWDTLSVQDIISQLKTLNRDAFYRMAENVDIDLKLLTESGYEYNGLSRIAVIELEAFCPSDKFHNVKEFIGKPRLG